MNCPKCNGELESRTLDDVQVHECTQCHGVWFEQNALRRAKDEANADLRWMDFDIWKDHDQFQINEHSLLCPSCQVKMAAIQYGSTQVTVDACPKCHGIWLDKGEFEQILSILEDQVASMSEKDYEKAALSEARELVTGKEGFISEWHDLTTVLRLLEYRILVDNPKVEKALVSLSISSPFK